MESSVSLRPADIGLILSYQCQSACKHCLYNCGPAWLEWIDDATLEHAIELLSSWGSVKEVHFTGGEPFLNFPLLLKAVTVASIMHIPTYVETNAGWCVHPDLAKRRFTALHDAGLNAVMISCSPFHGETIPLKRTLMAIGEALDVFGLQGVMVYQYDWIDQIRRFGTLTPTPLSRYIESFGLDPSGVMLWEGYGLISGGRAGFALGHLTDRVPAYIFEGQRCYQEILNPSQSHLDLYGNFIPGVCGGLSLCDWRKISLPVKEYPVIEISPLARILLESGPYGLYEFASEEYDFSASKAGYAGKCHLCVDVRRHLTNLEAYPELAPSGFYADSYLTDS
jgi:hypothetical protein